MSQDLAFPKVEVIDDGKPVPQERVNPSVMQFIMQAAATVQLVKLRKLEESKIPTRVIPLSMTITTRTTKLVLGPPWISFSLINDGPGALTVWVNDESEPTASGMIVAGESYNCDMTYPVIKTLYMKSASTSSVRIFGKEGKEQKS